MIAEPEDIKNLEGRKFRFVVSSAEDAAEVIKERLGPRARVLSVKQISGKGLTRFLTSPQLEIIVTVPTEDEAEAEKQERLNSIESSAESVEDSVKIDLNQAPSQTFGDESLTQDPAPHPQIEPKRPVNEILKRAGFDNNFLLGLKQVSKWKDLKSLPLSHGLAEVTLWMREQYDSLEKKPLTDKVAFFGVPGAGTTSALCKKLSTEAFGSHDAPQILKLEGESPNSDDALSLFCDILGTHILKDGVDEAISEKPLYVDVPGSTIASKDEWARLKDRMDELQIDSRVLVVNAAHDISLIKECFRLGTKMNATHVVFTNLDQINQYAKLWPFILHGDLPVLFLGHGQNVSSDLSKNPFDYLVHRTFPSVVLN